MIRDKFPTAIVYLVIRGSVHGEDLESYLLVFGDSDDYEEYSQDLATLSGLKDGYVFSYTVNLFNPGFSDAGDIVVEVKDGVVRRKFGNSFVVSF